MEKMLKATKAWRCPQRSTSTPPGIGVDRAEKIPQRIEEPDDEDGRAERLEIFRQESHPQFLARTDREGGDEEDDEVALESEKLSEALPSVHPRSETTMQTRDKRLSPVPSAESEFERQLGREKVRVLMER